MYEKVNQGNKRWYPDNQILCSIRKNQIALYVPVWKEAAQSIWKWNSDKKCVCVFRCLSKVIPKLSPGENTPKYYQWLSNMARVSKFSVKGQDDKYFGLWDSSLWNNCSPAVVQWQPWTREHAWLCPSPTSNTHWKVMCHELLVISFLFSDHLNM